MHWTGPEVVGNNRVIQRSPGPQPLGPFCLTAAATLTLKCRLVSRLPRSFFLINLILLCERYNIRYGFSNYLPPAGHIL